MTGKYYLIGWPDSQDFIGRDDCYLVDCGESSVYAVPCELIDEPDEVLDMNDIPLRCGDVVIWHDPDELARDLNRKYIVSRIYEDKETVLIYDDYSEAEVNPWELEII